MSLSIAQWPLLIARMQSPSGILAASASLLVCYAALAILPLRQEVSELRGRLSEAAQERDRIVDRSRSIERLQQEMERLGPAVPESESADGWIEPLIQQASEGGLRLVRLQDRVPGASGGASLSISLAGSSGPLLSVLRAAAESGRLPALTDLRLRAKDGTDEIELTLSAPQKSPVPVVRPRSLASCDREQVRDPFAFRTVLPPFDLTEAGVSGRETQLRLFGIVEGAGGRRALLGLARQSSSIVGVGARIDDAVVTTIERNHVQLRRRDGSIVVLRLLLPSQRGE